MSIKKILPALVLSAAMIGFGACSNDDDKSKDIEFNSLPQEARNFVNTYYPGETIIRVEHNPSDHNDAYEVYFASGAKAEFDTSGLWTEVDGAPGKAIPADILSARTYDYVLTYYPTEYITDASREVYGYEVGLNRSADLRFDRDGNYIDVD